MPPPQDKSYFGSNWRKSIYASNATANGDSTEFAAGCCASPREPLNGRMLQPIHASFKILSSMLPATRAKEKGELPCFLR